MSTITSTARCGCATTVSASNEAAGERRPLAAGQRRAWFLQTRDPQDTTLNICVAYRLSGALDPERLCAAVDVVVARHETLRTTYGLGADGEPYQLARDDLRAFWQEFDLSELPTASRARRLEVLARRALGEPFDLIAAAPLRVALIRTGTAEFVIVLVIHTICWDDDSWRVFRHEVNAAYNGAPPLCDQPAQFADVALAAHEPDEAAVEYWRRTLRPLPESLELPGRADAAATWPRPTGRCVVPVPPELVERVYAFAGAHGLTPFAILLAAYRAVIHRYTGATDFLISVPVSTRETAATSVIGYFGNTLLLRLDLRPADSFASFVAAVAETCAEAFANQSVGIDRVVREVNPGRAAGRDGLEQLVRVGFGVREGARGFDFDGITATAVELGKPVSPVPLRCTVVLDRDDIELEAEYWTEQLSPDLVEQLFTHLLLLLDSALAYPGCRVGDLGFFSEADRARILALSHGELVDTPPTTVVELFRCRVDATPGALAIVAPGRDGAPDVELTYDGLNRRANRLAHWLIGQGVGAEDIVALRVATSVKFVVAVLGVLKAGAAYLPIDPANPDGRIDLLDRDARPVLLLGGVELAAAEESAVALSEHDPTDTDRVRPLRPDNLAYVIYTSGSTGKPKGVPVSHAAIAEHLEGFCAEWGMTSRDRLLQSAPVSFDASVLDIFVTLTVGARMVIPKPAAFRDIPYIADLIARCGVTVLHMVPSTLSTFLLLPEVSEWGALRHVPVGGEALRGEVADRFAGVFDAELRNHYGPTEAVVSATHLPVEGPQGTRIVPIGVPNRNVYVYLLDERLHLVASGVVGEIYLGGAQLARGYLNRAGLTAERFIADPFLPGQRLYRTGDLARRNGDGEIEFVGRADTQVKVRGYRIELGEVEAALAGHPGVGQCVVVAVADRAIGTMLAAYVVPAAGFEMDLEHLRAHTAAVLPEYMVPTAFAVIDEIPLTPHGKLDRHALPEPVRNVAPDYRKPSTATEIRLAEYYARTFGLDQVGVEDSFFDLGGHSLLANRLVLWIREEFGVGLDVRVIFDTPTVAGVAALIEATSPAVRVAMTSDERERLVGEWATGIELPDVPGVAELVRRGRMVPGIRAALRHGARTLTYAELFTRLDAARVRPDSSLDELVARLAADIDSAHDTFGLAAAVADRRAVAAECCSGNCDPAYGMADVRLIAVRSDEQLVIELLAALADGATVLVPTAVEQADPAELTELVVAHSVTHVVADPATAAGIAHDEVSALPTIRRWDLVGTDAAPILSDRLMTVSAAAVATFGYRVSGYAGLVARGPLDGAGRARPIPGARVLVLDGSGEPVPPGALGEVYVGGAALLAADTDSFVADPFMPGGLLLRTGDQAWWNTEGWLMFA